jgi:hypothetical protein
LSHDLWSYPRMQPNVCCRDKQPLGLKLVLLHAYHDSIHLVAFWDMTTYQITKIFDLTILYSSYYYYRYIFFYVVFWFHYSFEVFPILNTGVQRINYVFHIVDKVENVFVYTHIFNLIDNVEYVVYALCSTIGNILFILSFLAVPLRNLKKI